MGAHDQRPHRFGSAGCWQYEISVRAECLCRNGKEGNHLVAGWVGIGRVRRRRLGRGCAAFARWAAMGYVVN